MRTLLGRPPIVIAVPLAHVTQYQNQYPLPYLVAIAFMFALVGTVWLTAIAPRAYRLHSLQIALVPFLTVLLVGPFWGMLWAYHDMQAGFFPDTPHMIDYLLFGAQYGFFFIIQRSGSVVPVQPIGLRYGVCFNGHILEAFCSQQAKGYFACSGRQLRCGRRGACPPTRQTGVAHTTGQASGSTA